MPSPEALLYANMLRSAPKTVEMALPDQRASGERVEALTTVPRGITYQPIAEGTMRALRAVPQLAAESRAVLYLFGGHVISSVNSRKKFAGHLANAAGCRCSSPIIGWRLSARFPLTSRMPLRLPLAAEPGVRAETCGNRLRVVGWGSHHVHAVVSTKRKYSAARRSLSALAMD